MSKQDKIQEMQFIEQTMQNLLLQKQAFQMELSETQAALEQVAESGDEVFKIIGQLMLKAEKEKIKEELLTKEKMLNLRIKAIEKQENSLSEKIEAIKKEIVR